MRSLADMAKREMQRVWGNDICGWYGEISNI